MHRTLGSGSGIEPSGQIHWKEPALFKHKAPWPQRFGLEHSSTSFIAKKNDTILNSLPINARVLVKTINTIVCSTYQYIELPHCLNNQLDIDMRNLLEYWCKAHLIRIFLMAHGLYRILCSKGKKIIRI